MEKIDLTVGGMTCASCVKTVTRALRAVPEVESVEVHLESGSVTVKGQAVAGQLGALVAALNGAGYQAHLTNATKAMEPTRKRGSCGSASAKDRSAGGCCCCAH